MEVTPDEYRNKAAEAELMLLKHSDPDLRLAYEKLALSWREVAHRLDAAHRAEALAVRRARKLGEFNSV
jgi:hypothetical protein